MDLNSQVLDEIDSLSEITAESEVASEPSSKQDVTMGATDGAEFSVSALGIAAVLFPATPPAAVNARLVRGLNFHDDSKKSRGLARAAGLFQHTWDDPATEAISATDPFSRNWS